MNLMKFGYKKEEIQIRKMTMAELRLGVVQELLKKNYRYAEIRLVKASNEVTADDVVAKAREGIKWCHFASTADPDHKVWEYRLISDDNIKLGNTCKYTLGTAHRVEEG